MNLTPTRQEVQREIASNLQNKETLGKMEVVKEGISTMQPCSLQTKHASLSVLTFHMPNVKMSAIL